MSDIQIQYDSNILDKKFNFSHLDFIYLFTYLFFYKINSDSNSAYFFRFS